MGEADDHVDEKRGFDEKPCRDNEFYANGSEHGVPLWLRAAGDEGRGEPPWLAEAPIALGGTVECSHEHG